MTLALNCEIGRHAKSMRNQVYFTSLVRVLQVALYLQLVALSSLTCQTDDHQQISWVKHRLLQISLISSIV